MALSFFILLALLALSASFSSLETALFSLSPVERHRLRIGSGVSTLIVKVLERPREVLTTVLFGNELVNVAISILAGGLAYELFQNYNPRVVYVIAIGVTTFFLLVFGEIVPKNVAIRNRVMAAQVLIVPFRLFAWLVFPFRTALTRIADRLVELFGADPRKGRMIVEEEFKTLLELGREQGTLADLERTLIQNALEFTEIPVCQIMTPREKMVTVPETLAVKEVLDLLYEKRFSRFPVYRETPDQIVGILHAKELAGLRLANPKPVSLKEILKPYAHVEPDQTLSHVFQEFKRKRIHIGIVKDNGVTVGLVTMDDLLRRLLP